MTGDRWVERHHPSINVRGRAEDLVAQAGIHRQPRCHLEIILQECREICVPLILAEQPRAASTEGHIACPTGAAILCGALSEQEIVERPDIQEPGSRKWRIDFYLMTFRFDTHAQAVIAASKRHRV